MVGTWKKHIHPINITLQATNISPSKVPGKTIFLFRRVGYVSFQEGN